MESNVLLPSKQLKELHLFSGCGGGILGGILLGHTCVCAVEIEPYRRKVLLQRQRDGILPLFPIWDDVRTFDGKPWRGRVDVVCGGFPCQDISQANGHNGPRLGLNGEKSGLWREMFRVVCEVGPKQVFVENSPMLTVRGLGTILSDLASVGYHGRWGMFRARDTGLCHRRKRMFILADTDKKRCLPIAFQRGNFSTLIQETSAREDSRRRHFGDCFADFPSETAFAEIIRDDDVLAAWVDRIAAIGDGQVPAVVALAWKTLFA
jgi:DNA (cytosine-5)-methyltransferase 1